ncbi:MAG: tetratricopeptide repeat protein [Bacteroidales bacterium]
MTRVLAVYIAAGFMILELIDMISGPFGLPVWSFKLALYSLIAGLFITVIISWIYDIHPEGGIVKTEPADHVSPEEGHPSSNSWKIASYISFVVIVGLIVLNIIPRSVKKEDLDKSIAVLPFINDSPDEENTYFINGIQEAILNNLSKIEDLRVVSRTSVLKYISDPKPIPQIAEEMNVSYVLEGSGQKYGNQIRLTLQLIDARRDRHLWSSPFTSQVEVNEIFNIQSQIAQQVAKQIEVVITPREKELIERTATTNQTAFELYLKANEERVRYYADPEDTIRLERAIELYNYAIEYDSAFALPYLALASIHWSKKNLNSDSLNALLDSAVSLTDLALKYDPELSDAHRLKGYILRYEGERDSALRSFNRAIEFNPNNSGAYIGKGFTYFDDHDFVRAISNFYQSTLLERTEDNLLNRYNSLVTLFRTTGFREQAEFYAGEILKISKDTISYYHDIALINWNVGDYQRSISYANKGLEADPSIVTFRKFLGDSYLSLGQNNKALESYEPYVNALDSFGIVDRYGMVPIGYAYYINGFEDKANEIFNDQIRRSEEWIKENRLGALGENYFLAAVWAIRGDQMKAIEYLERFNKQKRMEIYVMQYRDSPIFENIRNEPEFLRLITEMELKYQAEHERVRQWLEENEML